MLTFFLGDIIALRAMDMFSEFPFLRPVQPKNPREVWDVFCSGRLGMFGPPNSIQVDRGGEWKDEIWTG